MIRCATTTFSSTSPVVAGVLVDLCLPKTAFLVVSVNRGLAVVTLPPAVTPLAVTLFGLYPPTFPNGLLDRVVIGLAVVDDPS